MPNPLDTFGAASVTEKFMSGCGSEKSWSGVQFSTDVLVYDTGSRAVEATGKMPTRWGELKTEHQSQP